MAVRGPAIRVTCAPRIGTGIRRRSGAYTSPGSGAQRPPSPLLLALRPKGAEVAYSLARTIHKYLQRRPILSPGGAFLVRPSRRTASTPPSALLARSSGGPGQPTRLIHRVYRRLGYRAAETLDHVGAHVVTTSRRLKQTEQANV